MTSTREIITSNAIEALRGRIGQEHVGVHPFNDAATKDAIRHYAEGVGDNNPLWLNEDYANKTRYKRIIAPPLFVQTMGGVNLRHGYQQGLPGAHALHVGVEYHFFSPIYVNDQITSRGKLIDVNEKFHTGIADHAIIQEYQSDYYNTQTKALVCTTVHQILRFDREKAKEKGKYSTLLPHHYTKEEILNIEADRQKEQRRGAAPRFWEDVNIGEEIPPVIKGPLRLTDIILYIRGWGNVYAMPSWEESAYRKKHSTTITLNDSGIPDVVERIHWEDSFAKSMGIPAAIDYGTQRKSWVCQMFTNWMGDDGFLKTIEMRNWKINMVGDTSWIRGKVTGKRVTEGEHVVECEGWVENQRNETTLKVRAMISLPSKGNV